jgi:hypothetical protein
MERANDICCFIPVSYIDNRHCSGGKAIIPYKWDRTVGTYCMYCPVLYDLAGSNYCNIHEVGSNGSNSAIEAPTQWTETYGYNKWTERQRNKIM